MNEERKVFECMRCDRKILKAELDLNDGLCEVCATQLDDDNFEDE